MAAPLAGVLLRQASAIVRRKFASNHIRLLSVTSNVYGSFDAEFADAQKRLNTLKNDPGNKTKLQIYGLFKQATNGKCNTPKPGMMDFVGKAKWEAWNTLGDLSQDDAQKQYIEVVDQLLAAEGGTSSESAAEGGKESDSSNGLGCEGMDVEIRDNMTVITLNRPHKKNSYTVEMYEALPKVFKAASENGTSMTVITGTGDYFSSGNDLSNFLAVDPSQFEQEAYRYGEMFRKFVEAFINFDKPLVAIVNGPALGISCTTLALADVVYASDKATFKTPFSELGQTPEGLSSYTFPRLMGFAKANEMLIFNKKITAVEACDRGLVAEVFPDASFQSEIWPRLKEMASNPPKTMRSCKQLIRGNTKEVMLEVNKKEADTLVQAWLSEECMQAVMSFFEKKG